MLGLKLGEIDEAALARLGRERIPEGTTLEFKRQLDLATEKQKAEAARDLCAFANTAGGWILYGVDETELPDGSLVAGALVPQRDGAVVQVLVDVLNSAIHPRPIFDLRQVPLQGGGFVLVIEVLASYLDLHMVAAYGDYRYYARTPKGKVVMAEPEIRRRYVELAAAQQGLDAREAQLIGPELERLGANPPGASFLVTPFHARDGMFDPRRLRVSQDELERFFGHEDTHFGAHLHQFWWIQGDGQRTPIGEGDASQFYLALLRTGIIHCWRRERSRDFPDKRMFGWIVATLALAQWAYLEVGYFGPCRGRIRVRPSDNSDLRMPNVFPVVPVLRDLVVDDVRLMSPRDIRLAAKELLDHAYQTTGQRESGRFDDAGELTDRGRADLPARLINFVE